VVARGSRTSVSPGRGHSRGLSRGPAACLDLVAGTGRIWHFGSGRARLRPSVNSNPHPSTDVLWTAVALALDAVCGEVVSAWRAEGIESILLKGATVASWLYPDEVRPISDVDLLVMPDRLLDATAILRRLGFVPHDQHQALHAHPWTRDTDGVTVDLHVALWGALRPAAQVWEELQHWIDRQDVGGASVAVLKLPARALYVVIHAAQHADLAKPREDLRRALMVTSEQTWSEGVELADKLWALEAMAHGLALDPAGERLARRHRLIRAADMRTRGDAPFAIALARISNARGIRGRLAAVVALARNILRTVKDSRRPPGRP
jgi:hypothetical protein